MEGDPLSVDGIKTQESFCNAATSSSVGAECHTSQTIKQGEEAVTIKKFDPHGDNCDIGYKAGILLKRRKSSVPRWFKLYDVSDGTKDKSLVSTSNSPNVPLSLSPVEDDGGQSMLACTKSLALNFNFDHFSERRVSFGTEENGLDSKVKNSCAETPKMGLKKLRFCTRITAPHGEMLFQCNDCGQTYSKRQNANRHVRMDHRHGKKFPCTICGRVFKQLCDLTRHTRTHTGERPYKCDICTKTFSQQATLSSHMRTHTGEKPYQCAVCEKEFAHSCDLTQHMRSHTGEKPFKCPVCDRKFAQQGSQSDHIKKHFGERRYQCLVCTQEFWRMADLTKHTRTHTGDYPFTCTVCEKKFNQKSNLTVHMRTHTGEKPFSCVVCNQQFAIEYNMKKHMLVHTGLKPFKCIPCNRSYTTQGNLSKHLKRRHSTEAAITKTETTKIQDQT